MSDSDDFGGLGATTPNIPRKLPPRTRNEAGPSRAAGAGGGTSGRKKAPASVVNFPVDSDDEVQEIVRRRAGKRQRQEEQEDEEHAVEEETHDEEEEEEDADVQEVQRPAATAKGKTKTRAGSKKPASRSGATAVNGKTNKLTTAAAKGKGKAKAKSAPAKASSSRKQQAEPMDDDAIEVVDVDMDVDEPGVGTSLANAINEAGRSRTAGGGPGGKAARGNDADARWEERLRQANAHIEDLTSQLEELNQVRRTEAEQLLERMEAQFQAQLQAKDSLINDLSTQLERKDPLLRMGKNTAFELLTREEADKEMEGLKNQVKSYKDALRERDQRLKAKEEENETLQQTQNDLRLELQMERKTKSQQRQPPSASRPRTGGILAATDDPKIVQVINFYEDLTNLLVAGMKVQPGRFLNLEEWNLNCIYSYTDVVNKAAVPSKSLHFTLRLCHDIRSNASEPIVSKAQLVDSVHYTPLELDKETDEFVESLGFLNDTFTFERDQLSLFLRTLHDYVSGEGGDDKEEQDEGNDSDVQLIE